MDKLRKFLELAANRQTHEDVANRDGGGAFFDMYDAFGGNVDDAYEGGRENAEADLARWVLKVLNDEAS